MYSYDTGRSVGQRRLRRVLTGLSVAVVLGAVLVGAWLWGRATADPAGGEAAGANPIVTPGPPVGGDPGPGSPPAPGAEADPVRTAFTWLRAQRGSRFDDPAPTVWIDRVRPLVTPRLDQQNERQRDGSAGASWDSFVAGRCIAEVRDVDGVIPAEAPRTPDRASVQVVGTLVTTCENSQGASSTETIAATLNLVRATDGLWRVDEQLY